MLSLGSQTIKAQGRSEALYSKFRTYKSNIMNSLFVCSIVLVAICVNVSMAYPFGQLLRFVPLTDDQQFEESSFLPRAVIPANDLEDAATGHGHYGRVQIKVYRGPTTHGHHDHFTPHSFWVKQSADGSYHH